MVNIANFLQNKNKSPHRGLKLNCLEFLLTNLSECGILLLNRGECGVFAMASFEANCATITRFFLLNSTSREFNFLGSFIFQNSCLPFRKTVTTSPYCTNTSSIVDSIISSICDHAPDFVLFEFVKKFLLTFSFLCDILSLERDSAEVADVDGFEASINSVCPLRLAESLSILFLHIDTFDFL